MEYFAGQIHITIRKALARLIGVVDGAVHAVAEAEFAGEMDRQSSGAIGEIFRLDALDDCAVIALGEHAGDGLLQVETLAENQRRHRDGRGARMLACQTLRPVTDCR
jgi:hypothetical protein